ncbi:uncharacterized protein LOC133917880 [Phragmites australis]|uniref:uncharacterized protein LOC133917880 n=1 Tax=Phragmites australis TaxID=29695 RepID=UPI002D784A95|nr:uncharacterized protein LOC133917880 [Phragmites australis]
MQDQLAKPVTQCNSAITRLTWVQILTPSKQAANGSAVRARHESSRAGGEAATPPRKDREISSSVSVVAGLPARRPPSPRSLSIRCCAAAGADPGEPPQDAVLKAISQIASSKGRVAQTTNVIMGGTVTNDATDEWLVLDKKVYTYPTVRGFTAIGTGGDDFVQSMVVAVESVLQERIPEGQISQKVSSKGKYVSVKIGPIRVVSGEQVQAVYNAMKKDERMKFFL